MRGRPRIRVLVGGLAVLSAASFLGNAISPTLVTTEPMLLILLTPRAPFVLAAAAGAPLLGVLAVGVPRLLLADPAHFLIGRRHGGRMRARLPRPMVRFGLPAIVIHPSSKVLLAAGAAALRPLHVAAADVVGTTLRVTALWLAANGLPGAAALCRRGYVAPLLVVTTTGLALALSAVTSPRRAARVAGPR